MLEGSTVRVMRKSGGSGVQMSGGMTRRNALKTLAAATGGIALLVEETGGGAGANQSPLQTLGNKLTGGRVVRPGDPDYESARTLWDAVFVSHPKVIVFCRQPQDAVAAIVWARKNGVPIRARSGRHCLEGWSGVDGGITIDVSSMKNVSVDSLAGTATIAPGNTQSEAVAALGATGLTIPTGSEATVGLGGVTLGGGIGFLSRSQGVTCDNLVALDIAVPAGREGARLIHVDEKNHPDLLWACRGGGGGNFGVATSFTFRTHALATASACEVVWPFADWQPAFTAWQEWSHTTHEGFGSNFAVLGKQADYVALQGVFTGTDSALREHLAPLLAVGNPTIKTSSGSYVDVFNYFNQSGRTTANWRFSSSWAYDALEQHRDRSRRQLHEQGSRAAVQLLVSEFWWGPAVEPAGGSAWFHRTPLFYAEPGAGWNDPGLTDACESWLHHFRVAMDPHVVGGYVNVPDAVVFGLGDQVPRLELLAASAGEEGVRPLQRVQVPTEHPAPVLMRTAAVQLRESKQRSENARQRGRRRTSRSDRRTDRSGSARDSADPDSSRDQPAS